MKEREREKERKGLEKERKNGQFFIRRDSGCGPENVVVFESQKRVFLT